MKLFTQEVKDRWIKALESGKYLQGFRLLYTEDDNSFCCIGVLGEIEEYLFNDAKERSKGKCPYKFLEKNEIDIEEIYRKNDKDRRTPKYKRDYSNVLEIIKNLKTKEL